MIAVKPTIKVSFGLVMVTVSLFLIGDLIGIMPNEDRGLLDGRKKFCESLAVQFSLAVTEGDLKLVDRTLETLVHREQDILSAALITATGQLMAEAGAHRKHWKDIPLDQSTSTHVQVPVFHGSEQWGSMQVTFAPLRGTGSILTSSFSQFYPLLYLMLAGFAAYWLFIKRTLRELDPGAVIPERVKSAFNALAEGLVIMDEKGQIILANESFARKVEYPADMMLGRRVSRLSWQKDRSGKESKQDFPWEISLREKKQMAGIPLRYKTRRHELRTFVVNTSPILGAGDSIRGVLATFDDLTDLETKQIELKQTITQLQHSQEALREKTVELEYLATRDPLTGCFNRRAFFEKCQHLFEEARRLNRNVACIMTDIDHFKSVNDRHGHATGDRVIQLVANELRAKARPDDIVARYGGEEFCIILPNVSTPEALLIAERLRTAVKMSSRGQFNASLRITASFGISDLSREVSSPEELIDRADKALYWAKEQGRNRAVCWEGSHSSDKSVMKHDLDMRDHENSPDRPYKGTAGSAAEDAEIEFEALNDRIGELEEELRYSQELLSKKVGRDELTGLPNRVLFFDRIAQALARGQRYDRIAAVIVLDIDVFQRVNEALGQIVGDQLIKIIGQRLHEILRCTDTISHLGGESANSTVSRTGADEFAILLTDIQDVETVTWVVKRILDSLATPLEVDGNKILTTCSAGISLFPHDGDNPETLITNASAARFRAKQRLGKSNMHFYSADINRESYRQLWFESHLHHALEQGEFSLNFQPKIDMRSGRITSMEALIRWHSPKMGWIPPDEFIPIAERTGLIREIGNWVMREACEQARGWMDGGFDDVGVAVNLSPMQFRHPDLFQDIRSTLQDYELDAGLLELEITENTVMDNLISAVDTLKHMAGIGLKISVDDFGTGYSSLAYLKHFPAHTLKIDRSFLSDAVPDEQDALIISAIVAMAHSMNLSVVAEGVETGAQKQFLEKLGCDEVQGYLFSKPVPANEIPALLRRYNGEIAGSREVTP